MTRVGETFRSSLLKARRINPLNRFAPWMLKHAQTLWRLSILDMIFWVICAHVVAFLLGLSWSQHNALAVGIDHIARVQAGFWWFIAVMGVYWAFNLIRWPMSDTSWKAVILSWATVVSVTYAFLVVPNAYFASLTEKMTFRPGALMGEFEQKAQITKDRAYLARVISQRFVRSEATSLICTNSGDVNTVVLDRLDRIAEDLSIEWRAQRPGSDHWNLAIRRCQEQDYTEALKLLTTRSDDLVIESRVSQFLSILDARVFALDFSSGSTLERYIDAVTSYAAVPAALILGTLLLSATHYALPMARFLRDRQIGLALGRRLQRSSPFANYDRYLVRKAPLSWAFGAHRSILIAFLMIGASYLLREQLLEAALELTDFLDDRFGAVASATAAVLIPLFLSSTFLLLFWYQKRYVGGPETLECPRRFLMALMVPPLLSLMVVMTVVHLNAPVGTYDFAGFILVITPPIVAAMAIISMLISHRGFAIALVTAILGLGLAYCAFLAGAATMGFGESESVWAFTVAVCVAFFLGGYFLMKVFKSMRSAIRFIVTGAILLASILPSSLTFIFLIYDAEELDLNLMLPLLILQFIGVSWLFVSPFIRNLADGQFDPRETLNE